MNYPANIVRASQVTKAQGKSMRIMSARRWIYALIDARETAVLACNVENKHLW